MKLSPVVSLFRRALPCALLVLSGQAWCQDVSMQFSLYRTDAKFGDALQAKLLTGGQEATQAMGKMPDLIRQGRAKLEAELKQQTPDKQRAVASSGNKMHKNPDDSEAKLGFEIEFEPVISTGVIHCRLAAQYNLEGKDGVKSHLLTSMFTAKSGTPVLISRWQEGDGCLMLVATATFDSPAATGPIRMLYLDTTFFQSESDAKANRNPVARAVYPAKSGQRTSSSVQSSLYYKVDEDWEMEPVGWNVEAAPVLTADDASVSLSVVATHQQATGDKRKLPDGARIPEVIHRTAQHTGIVPIAASRTADITSDQVEAPAAKAQHWKLSTQCLMHEVK